VTLATTTLVMVVVTLALVFIILLHGGDWPFTCSAQERTSRLGTSTLYSNTQPG
jgi:hypothetical protein